MVRIPGYGWPFQALFSGRVYGLIAIGYTLVYGILFMINFAHGDIMMVGCLWRLFCVRGLASRPRSGGQFPRCVSHPLRPAGIRGRHGDRCGRRLLSGKDRLSSAARRPAPGAAHQCHWRVHLSGERGATPVRQPTARLRQSRCPDARHGLESLRRRKDGCCDLHGGVYLCSFRSDVGRSLSAGPTHAAGPGHARGRRE